MAVWGVAEAEARFGAVLDKVDLEGPQVVTRRGTGTYVVLREEEWLSTTKPEQNLVDFLACPPDDGVDVDFPRLKGKPRPVRF